MLSFAEEILLLLLEDEEGRFIHVPELSMRCVLSGAVLLDLALKNKIDSDMEKLTVIDPEPLGDALLDPVLKEIVEHGAQEDARYWVDRVARSADGIKERALSRLCEKGILEEKDDRVLWVFKSRRYPIKDGEVDREVRHKIISILYSDEIPSPEEVVMVLLVDACGIFKHLLSEMEHKRFRSRIRQIREMDLLGQAVTKSVRHIEASLALALHPPF